MRDGLARELWFPRRRSNALSRAFDVSCAVLGLLILWPLFLVTAIAIKLDDCGPVFYTQTRVGRKFVPFRLIKFRSMGLGAEAAGPLTIEGDPRVTRVGRFLRKYKVDELPQLFNVLLGEMRLVGPRPEVERYVEMFPSEYAMLLQAEPGITDPASLAYLREEQTLLKTDAEKRYVSELLPRKLSLSLAYQARRNFFSDIQILIQTARAIFSKTRPEDPVRNSAPAA